MTVKDLYTNDIESAAGFEKYHNSEPIDLPDLDEPKCSGQCDKCQAEALCYSDNDTQI
jgi:hypothetical protein